MAVRSVFPFLTETETDLLQAKEILPYPEDSEIPLAPKRVAGSLSMDMPHLAVSLISVVFVINVVMIIKAAIGQAMGVDTVQ
jgi:hypothetical protein